MFAVWKDETSKMIYISDDRKMLRNFVKITEGPDRNEIIHAGTRLAKEMGYLCAILLSNEDLDLTQE